MENRSKLIKMEVYNFGPFGPDGATIELDNILCLVGENNSGKSTILKAYEYAVGNRSMLTADRCSFSKQDENPEVIIYVHIPKDTPNIAEKWKIINGNYLLVKSRWQWDIDGKISRQTWDPEIGDYAENGKAAGLDTVFSSRLPKPFRIGTLEDPEEEHKKLLTLILQPIAEKLKIVLEDKESELNKSIAGVSELAKVPINEEKKSLNKLKEGLNKTHNEIFPNLKLDLHVDIGEVKIDPLKLLRDNSYVKVLEWAKELQWTQQGTGSQRALFWAMMQVRSALHVAQEMKNKIEKDVKEKEKEIAKLQKAKEKAKKEEKRQEKENEIKELLKEIKQLKEIDVDHIKEKNKHEFSLPSYMLLIDEPEVALHPKAVRTASKYLYGLAKDPSWQVMLSTHSPIFINPLEDHTTIIRLSREKNNPTPQVYKSDDVVFTMDEVVNLKMLNKFDTNLAEIFFGGYPLIVEGDTEYAAFEYLLTNNPEDYGERPLVTRAHGKATICLIIRMLRHFKIPFSVLHDLDFPFRSDGKRNSAWSVNKKIYDEIQQTRKEGMKVMHRISIPYFEAAHIPPQIDSDGKLAISDSKDKPWKMINEIMSNDKTQESVKESLLDLVDLTGKENLFSKDFEKNIEELIYSWATGNKISDERIKKKE